MRIACIDGFPVVVIGDEGYSLEPLLPPPAVGDGPAERMITLARNWPAVEAVLRRGGELSLPDVDVNGHWAAPVPRPGKIVAAPVNYRSHAAEMGTVATIEEQSVFLKAGSSVIGPMADVVLPFPGRRTDQEAELAVVIGRTARHVAESDALNYVMGYTCLVDVTLRGPEDRSGRKSFDTFTPLGPWITTPDEVADPGALRIRSWVNGDLRQDASTTDLIYSVERLIAHASAGMTLQPGDVVTTGTPAGVGPLSSGDRVVVEIERVGRLEVGVRAA